MEDNKLSLYLLYQLYHTRVLLHSLQYDANEENIHEFRVTLRRVRSLSKLFLNDLPFPKILKTAMKETNGVRELDVLIGSLRRSKYPKLFKYLSKRRKTSAETIFTPNYRDKTLSLIEEYSLLISQNDPHFIPEILIQKVLTHYQHFIDSFSALQRDSDPKTLHHLRIKFKDARYGFEFLEIAGIHQSQEVILHCKQLQNTLGSIQDTVNQIDLLKKIYQAYPSEEVKDLVRKRKKELKLLKDTTKSELSPSI